MELGNKIKEVNKMIVRGGFMMSAQKKHCFKRSYYVLLLELKFTKTQFVFLD